MSEEHDSWFKSAFGVDLGASLGKLGDEASAAVSSAASGVSEVVQGIGGAVGQAASAVGQAASGVGSAATGAVNAASGAVSAAAGAAKKAVQAFVPGASGGPMADDCKPVRGKVPGPANHVLCGTHGHVLDTQARQIIAASLDDYKAGRMSSGPGIVALVAAAMPGLPFGGPGMPGMPGPPGGGPLTGPFPPIGGVKPTGFSVPSVPAAGAGSGSGATGGILETAGKVVETVAETAEVVMEGIAIFDAVLIGGLILVAGGVIAGIVIEVQSSEQIADLPGDVERVTATLLAGYRAGMLNGAKPGESAGSAGWLVGHDIATKRRADFAKNTPPWSEEQILAALTVDADGGMANAKSVLRRKAQESVWISYAAKHQDSKWKTYMSDRFRAWRAIFGVAPQRSEKLWKDYLNEHSNLSSPLSGVGADTEPRKAPGAPSGGPAVDPSTGLPASAPGSAGSKPISDPGSPEAMDEPGSRDGAPMQFVEAGSVTARNLGRVRGMAKLLDRMSKANLGFGDLGLTLEQVVALLNRDPAGGIVQLHKQLDIVESYAEEVEKHAIPQQEKVDSAYAEAEAERRFYREELLGKTPGKDSPVGRQVMERMRQAGKVRGAPGRVEVLHGKQWYPLAECEMGHTVDAVTWWKNEGMYYGDKSGAVRDWMNDPNNYELEPASINRSRGAQVKDRYVAPHPDPITDDELAGQVKDRTKAE